MLKTLFPILLVAMVIGFLTLGIAKTFLITGGIILPSFGVPLVAVALASGRSDRLLGVCIGIAMTVIGVGCFIYLKG
jgi:hypothetical protein